MIVESVGSTPDVGAEMRTTSHDLERLLSVSLIREHTKTNDIPTVTDAMLAIYRDAAIFAAEKYTGLILRERRVISEQLSAPRGSVYTRRRPEYRHRVKFPFATPIAFVYGHLHTMPKQIMVDVGSRDAIVPIMIDDFSPNCCDPCATQTTGKIQYYAGFNCVTEMPAPVVLGALKYIAHVMENPGDIVTATNEAGNSSSGSVGVSVAANPAVASGAVDIWRTVNDGAI